VVNGKRFGAEQEPHAHHAAVMIRSLTLALSTRWAVHADLRFADYMARIRKIFESKGVLTER
jgi:hypothetical protein